MARSCRMRETRSAQVPESPARMIISRRARVARPRASPHDASAERGRWRQRSVERTRLRSIREGVGPRAGEEWYKSEAEERAPGPKADEEEVVAAADRSPLPKGGTSAAPAADASATSASTNEATVASPPSTAR